MPDAFLQLAPKEQAEILQTFAGKLGRRPEHLEKDVWICWVLQGLFTMPGRLPMAFKNESKYKVAILGIQILRGDTSYESPLTEQVKPRQTDDWTLEPRSSKSFFWAPQHDAKSMLQSLVRSPDPNFPNGNVIPIALVLTVRLDGKRVIKKKYIQNVLFQGNQILPWGP